jgi:hypothetical protein
MFSSQKHRLFDGLRSTTSHSSFLSRRYNDWWSNLFAPSPLDSVGQQKMKIRAVYYFFIFVALLAIFIAILLVLLKTYPLVLVSQDSVNFDKYLPFFTICFNQTVVQAKFSNIGVRILGVGDCLYGSYPNVTQFFAKNCSCEFIHYIQSVQSTASKNRHCVFVTPNSSHWLQLEKNRPMLRLTIVISMTSLSSKDTVSWLPLGHFLFFSWIPPNNYDNVIASFDPFSLPLCNIGLLAVNGITLIRFSINSFERAKEICYKSSTKFVHYTSAAQQQICKYINETFFSLYPEDCSYVVNETDDYGTSFVFLQLQIKPREFHLRRFKEEDVGLLFLQIFYHLGSIRTLLLPILSFLFIWVLTRWTFWKQRDAYYTDEVRAAVIYFIQKERQLNKRRMQTSSL